MGPKKLASSDVDKRLRPAGWTRRSLDFVFLMLLLAFSPAACVCHQDCAIPPGVTLHFVDAESGQPVMVERGAIVLPQSGPDTYVYCADTADDGQSPCAAWAFNTSGAFAVHIQPAGYQPTDFSANIELGGGCCVGPDNPVNETVRLNR